MNFIETLFDNLQKSIKQSRGEYPNDIKNFCIGSGSNFTIHKHISIFMANRIYKDYKASLPLGRQTSKKEVGTAILESFNTIESSNGTTYTFMFEVGEVKEHNPNDIIDEWIETSKQNKDFMTQLLKSFIKERQNNEHKQD